MIVLLCVLAATFVSAGLFTRHLARIANNEGRFRFRIVDLLLLMICVALLGSAGFAGDSLVVVLFLTYSIFAGPAWLRLFERRARSCAVITCLTSATIVASFIALLTTVALLISAVGPSDLDVRWDSSLFPRSVVLSLLPGALIAWACILGDNYRGNQLVIYGFPLSMLINVAIGFVAGLILGFVADSLARTHES